MTHNSSDSDAAAPTGNLGDIDCRAVLECGAPHPANSAPSQDGTDSHATLVRRASMAPDSVAQAARRSYPRLPRASISGAASAVTGTEAAPVTNATSLRALLRLRHVRAALFPGKIFAQPAWDMLIELLECHLRQRPISVSGIYLAAGVPPSTALRRLQDMEDAGLIVRVGDPNDRRRQFVELTPRTLLQFQAFVRHGDVLRALNMADGSKTSLAIC
jgi:DNA-binding MarR family transcriptional regulator